VLHERDRRGDELGTPFMRVSTRAASRSRPPSSLTLPGTRTESVAASAFATRVS